MTFKDTLKEWNALKVDTFRSKTDVIENARAFKNYLKRIDTTFETLEVSNPAVKLKIFKLHEYKISTDCDSGVDDSLATQGNEWEKFKKKLEIYHQTDKLTIFFINRLNK